tara:strand:+ start:3240 stop:4004 length:765 start_codon:yes stop_codon:yes gene_type:complete
MVSIDNVYQKVLTVSNKEQRGYITPQEFNLLANTAQMDIFNSYFGDIREAAIQPNLDINIGNKRDIMNDKIGPFKIYKGTVQDGTDSDSWEFKLPDDLYYLGNVYYANTGGHRIISPISTEDFHNSQGNYKTKPRISHPVYTRPGTHTGSSISSHIRLYPHNTWTATDSLPHFSVNNVEVDYIKKPSDPKWGYVVVNGKALYNASSSNNFDLHSSEESSLVNKILELAGIVINKPGLSEVAIRNEQMNEAKKNR